METTTATAVHVPLWAWLAAVAGAVLLYVVLQENGALVQTQWQLVHEFFHDGRHALGVPCH